MLLLKLSIPRHPPPEGHVRAPRVLTVPRVLAGVGCCAPEGDASAEGGGENGLVLLIVQCADAHGWSRKRWPANKLQLSREQSTAIQQTEDGSV